MFNFQQAGIFTVPRVTFFQYAVKCNVVVEFKNPHCMPILTKMCSQNYLKI